MVTKKEPKADRPSPSKSYVIRTDLEGMLPCAGARERLEQSHNYSISTTRPDGCPHGMPVWGVWLDDAIHFGTGRNSTKARNLSANPAAVMHLESEDDVVTLEGTVRRIADKKEIAAADAAYLVKYKMKLTDAPGELFLCAFKPKLGLAWHGKNFSGERHALEVLKVAKRDTCFTS
jgi:hypothetical protein